MSDSDFGFDGGQSDSDFGFDGSSSSSDEEEVISTLPVDEDVLVEAQIDESSGDDSIVATAEIVTRKCCPCRYTIQEKLMLLRQVHRQMNNGASQHSVCNSININRKLIDGWNKQLPQLIDAMNNKVKSLCKGMQSCSFPFSDSLLSFIFELREQGMAVNTSMILMKAAKISRQFHMKSHEKHRYLVSDVSLRHKDWYTNLAPMNHKGLPKKPKLKHWTSWESYVQSCNCNVGARLSF